MSIFLIAIVFFLSLLRANAQNFSYIGGIPLRTPDSCPAGSVVGQITFEQNCCGADQTFVKLEGSVCCESSSDCYDEVIAAPKCADPSWQLCGTNQGGFCCEQDWVCFTQSAFSTNGGGVGCSTPGATLSAGQSEVTTVYAANAGPHASTTAAASSSSSSSSSSSTPIPSTTVDSTIPTSTSTPPATLLSSSGSQVASAVKTNSASQITTPVSSGVSSMSTRSISTSASSSSSSSSSTSSPESSPGSSSEGSSSGSTSKKSSSITGGAIAGIVIGALALVGVAFAGGVWFSRRKRNPDSMDYLSWGKPKGPRGLQEMDTTPDIRRELEAEVPGNGYYGVGSNSSGPASELPAHHGVVELDAGYKR